MCGTVTRSGRGYVVWRQNLQEVLLIQDLVVRLGPGTESRATAVATRIAAVATFIHDCRPPSVPPCGLPENPSPDEIERDQYQARDQTGPYFSFTTNIT